MNPQSLWNVYCKFHNNGVNNRQSLIRPKQNMLVSCHMPKKVRVGRSDFFIFFTILFIFFAKRDFVDKIGGKSGLQKKRLKIVKTVIFG